MFIAAVNLLQEVIYHSCIIVVSPLYHRYLRVGRNEVLFTKNKRQGVGGGGVIQLVTMQMTNRPMERKTKRTHIDKQITAERDKRQRVEESVCVWGGGGGD